MGHKSRDLTLRICHLPTLGESLNGSALIYKMRAGVTALCVWLGGNTDPLVNESEAHHEPQDAAHLKKLLLAAQHHLAECKVLIIVQGRVRVLLSKLKVLHLRELLSPRQTGLVGDPTTVLANQTLSLIPHWPQSH